jgi:hypothetical protein
LTAISGVRGRSSTLGNDKACSNQSQHLSVQGDAPFGDCCRYLQAADCGDSNLSRSSDLAVCSTAKTRRIAYPPKPSVGVQHNHRSTSHSSSIGATMSPRNFTLPKRSPGTPISVGTTLATGLPLLVTISGWRVRATLSKSARQWALKCPAGTVLGCCFMVTFYDHGEHRSTTHGVSFYTPMVAKKPPLLIFQ